MSFRLLGAMICLCLLSSTIARAQSGTPAVGSEPAPQIAFTFDDLPAHGPLPPGEDRPEPVREILAALKAANMPPVYGFVNGFRVTQFPYQEHILNAWHAAGQPMGSHTYSHPGLDQLTARSYINDIQRNEEFLRRADEGGDWRWFRYPFLEEGNTLSKRDKVRTWLSLHGYRIAEISMDFQDYNWNDTYARCSVKKDEVAIRHLHDTYLSAASQAVVAFRGLSHTLYGRDVRYILLMHVGAFDAKMLPELLAQFRSEGFEFVTLEKAAADEAYSFDPHQTTKGGSTFLEQVAAARKVNVPDLPDYSVELARMCH
ncbi:MAG: polysaccharide deacetylase family protein [Acidobacteriaceae bacterium]|nr:polysaccharide deacetylase family protein [Acidobacteriaceae bacterium]